MADELCDAASIEAADEAYVMRPWAYPAGEPVIVASARDCRVTDIRGKDYLDLTAGYFVNNAGHCHPRVAKAVTEQLDAVAQVSGKHGTVPAIRLAKRLIELTPRSVDKVFFSTGGSEANEFALKAARQFTGKRDVAYLENGYHGLTLGALEVTASERYRESAGKPLARDSYSLPNAYCYRCKFGPSDACSVQCLDGVEATLDAHPDTAAIIAEPIQAVGGLAPQQRWWERLDAIRRARGVLLIADEVQTGLGRTGTMFAVERYGLEPELMTSGKGLSGGVGSLAATLASAPISAAFFTGTAPTSGGNAVSAAAGLAMIDVVIDEQLASNAVDVGRYFTEAAWALRDPWIGDVRFVGLLGGVELVQDLETRAVLGRAELSAVKDGLHDRGMLITISGPHGNVLRLQPPLTFTTAMVDAFCAALGEVLHAVRGA